MNDSDELKIEFADEISPWISMAYPTWIIFFRENTTIDSFFRNIYIPFDCIFLVVEKSSTDDEATLTEIYQIDKERELRISVFGYWNLQFGVTTPKLGLYQRRGDLFGQNLRVSSIEDPPVSLIVRNQFGQMVGLNGFFGKVVSLLGHGMNCTFTFEEAREWGLRMSNGSWIGAIGMLTRNEVDLIAAELMMATDRLEDVEYTTPVYTTKCRTYIKRPSFTAVKWKAYTAPFQSGIWYSLGILIIVSSASISFVKVVTETKILKQVRNRMTFSETTFLVFGAFCNQGMDPSDLDTVMIIQLVIHVTAVVILAAYSAALISFLAVKVFIMPFTTMEGLLKDGTYRFGVISNSADFSFFQNTSDKILQVMFDEILDRDDLPPNYFEGLKKVCEEENYAFMAMDNMVAVLQPRVNCILEPLDVMMQTTIGMAVRKWSPYKGIINSNLLMMRDSGILQRLFSIEWAVQPTKNKDGWTSVEIIDILPLILLIGGGIFLAGILLSVEKTVSLNLIQFETVKKAHKKQINKSN